MFIKGSPNSHGFVNARDTEDLWKDHFDYFYREYDEFIFVSFHSSGLISCDLANTAEIAPDDSS